MSRSIGHLVRPALLFVLLQACVSAPRATTQTATGPVTQPPRDPPVAQAQQAATGQEPIATGQATIASPLPAGQMRYTTFFYTAAEAVVQGYEPDTSARIVSMENGQTVWAGTVGPGDATLVSTGRGVFSFISDRKAAILVGTPSSCTVVGYWARNQDGSFLSDHFYVRLPASVTRGDDERVLVWSWEPTQVSVRDVTSGATLFDGQIAARGRFEIPGSTLAGMGSHVLEVRAQRPSVAVQVYYDEGFGVPSSNGRSSGTDFLTYLGRITEGVNDLVLVSYRTDARVRVEDITSGEVVLEDTVRAGAVRTLTLSQRFLRVRSDVEISVAVAPFEHYRDGYAEHHYSGGGEGTGIDNDFIVTTPGELWIFSYFDNNRLTVQDLRSGQEVWHGTLSAGSAQGLSPGYGLFRVRGTAGTSVMGGSQSCGGEYSPAARLFQVDEALAQAIVQIQQDRRNEAAARGQTLSTAAAAAPLNDAELRRATESVEAATGSRVFDAPAVRQRIEAMQQDQ